ncbi:hypothetical protein SAMN02799630_05925 [Paenibacillus sp. UNCCL117]|nr:hypothetical protein SAMN04488602_1366 [Paenibacillus sp. cl123]SFW69769.1 hypothetical protein SAMN02799630_05925 [Paenibacillus sp. UNCCL117]
MLNALEYGCRIHQVSFQDVLQYNFYYHFDREHDVLSGSVDLDDLLLFMENRLPMKFRLLDLHEVDNGEDAIISLDAYELSYLADQYQTVHQMHYVFARVIDNSVHIVDSYYNKKFILSKNEAESLWSYHKKRCLALERNGAIEWQDPIDVPPYMLSVDYKKKYKETNNLFMKEAGASLCLSKEAQASKIKRYFSCFRSISQNRHAHFSANKSNGSIILNSWNQVLKTMILLEQDTKQLGRLEEALEEACGLETNYLEQMERDRL